MRVDISHSREKKLYLIDMVYPPSLIVATAINLRVCSLNISQKYVRSVSDPSSLGNFSVRQWGIVMRWVIYQILIVSKAVV